MALCYLFVSLRDKMVDPASFRSKGWLMKTQWALDMDRTSGLRAIASPGSVEPSNSGCGRVITVCLFGPSCLSTRHLVENIRRQCIMGTIYLYFCSSSLLHHVHSSSLLQRAFILFFTFCTFLRMNIKLPTFAWRASQAAWGLFVSCAATVNLGFIVH